MRRCAKSETAKTESSSEPRALTSTAGDQIALACNNVDLTQLCAVAECDDAVALEKNAKRGAIFRKRAAPERFSSLLAFRLRSHSGL